MSLEDAKKTNVFIHIVYYKELFVVAQYHRREKVLRRKDTEIMHSGYAVILWQCRSDISLKRLQI